MTPDDLTSALLDRTLPVAEWTHRGHLTAGYVLVRRLGAAAALATLRDSIAEYNASVGNENTDSAGYHETITAYYVWAVDRLVTGGADLDGLLVDPLVERRAPLRFWHGETLFSVAARRAWVAPDLVDPEDDGVPRLPGTPVPHRLHA